MSIYKIKGCLYLEGLYQIKDIKSNYSYPCEFPTVFTAKGKGVQSGNWQSCTAINTPKSIVEFYNDAMEGKELRKLQSLYEMSFPNLTITENYELAGLIYSIAHIAEAYSVVRFGNHGTHSGKDIKNKKAASAIFEAVKPMIARANELISKFPQF